MELHDRAVADKLDGVNTSGQNIKAYDCHKRDSDIAKSKQAQQA
jgi:hypothetical protein